MKTSPSTSSLAGPPPTITDSQMEPLLSCKRDTTPFSCHCNKVKRINNCYVLIIRKFQYHGITLQEYKSESGEMLATPAERLGHMHRPTSAVNEWARVECAQA
jgi:hypothetical protein